MTKKWSEMTVEQRDILIAEKVFGHNVRLAGQGFTRIAPNYSTDMNAAWDALKHAALGFPEHLADRAKLVQELFLLPQAQDTLNAHYALGMMCAWTPENICKAILKAYGVEVEVD